MQLQSLNSSICSSHHKGHSCPLADMATTSQYTATFNRTADISVSCYSLLLPHTPPLYIFPCRTTLDWSGAVECVWFHISQQQNVVVVVADAFGSGCAEVLSLIPHFTMYPLIVRDHLSSLAISIPWRIEAPVS